MNAPDDSKRKGPFMSWQEHDIWYVIDRVLEHFPVLTRADVEHTVRRIKSEIQPASGREKLVERVREAMKNGPWTN
jgi:hypothetical protein